MKKPVEGLTPKQHQVLRIYRQYTQKWGYAPTFREVGAKMGGISPVTVLGHVRELIKKRKLRKSRRKAGSRTTVLR